MGRTNKGGVAGKFGARYGIRIRKKINDVARKQTKECPYCNRNQLKRLAAGIWECKKCNSKFAGGTYIPTEGGK